MKRIKRAVFNAIRDDEQRNLINKIIEGVIIALIVLAVIFIFIDTFDLSANMRAVLIYFEYVSVGIFAIEYLLRLWTADLRFPQYAPALARLRYLLSFMALADLLAILPFYMFFFIPINLRALRTLRLFRLLRLFKLGRYTKTLSHIGNVIKEKAPELVFSVVVIFFLMIISSVLMYDAESAVQPHVFKNAFSGFWWVAETLTTIGYGDIVPVTVMGKILSGLIAVCGICLIAVPTGIISAGFIEQIRPINDLPMDDSTADELIKLKSLLDSGALTQREYNELKKKLLNGRYR